MWEVKVAYDLGILKHCGPITSYKKRLIKFRSSLHISFSLLKCFNTHQTILYRRTPRAFCNVYHSPTLLKIGSISISLSLASFNRTIFLDAMLEALILCVFQIYCIKLKSLIWIIDFFDMHFIYTNDLQVLNFLTKELL